MPILITNTCSRVLTIVAALSLSLQVYPVWAVEPINIDSAAQQLTESATKQLPEQIAIASPMTQQLPEDIVSSAKSTDKDTSQQPQKVVADSDLGSAVIPLRGVTVPTTAPGSPTNSTTTAALDDAVLRAGVAVSPGVAHSKIDDLTRQILLKEIELERFNMHYTTGVAKQGRWKAWRYGGIQELNAGMGLTGSIIGTAERASHIHSPTHIHTELQESANYIPMIGTFIGAGAALMEFTINEGHELHARGKGFSPGKAVAYVGGLKDDINRLLAERDALIAVENQDANLAAHVSVDNVEGKVLRDLRDESLQEFERFHIGARKLLAFQQSQYLFDLAKYTMNGLGFEAAYEALHIHERYYNARAGTYFNISGGLFIIGPIVSRVFAKGIGEIHRHRLRPTTQEAEATKVDQLVSDHAMLDKLCSAPGMSGGAVGAVDRSSIYGSHEKTFQDEIRSGQKNQSKAKLAATQNIGAGLFVGGCKVAQGTLFSVVGYDHQYNTHSDRSAKVTNTNLFAASVVGIPAGVFSIADTLRIQVTGEINRHKLAKAGMLPRQLADARLAELDSMEARLKK